MSTIKMNISLCAWAGIFAASFPGALQAAKLSIPEYPLFQASTGVPPNLVLTLDDSGSMAAAYTPDLCPGSFLCENGSDNVYDNSGGLSCANSYDIRRSSLFACNVIGNRYLKSSYYNPMYYNPRIKYPAPSKINTSTGAPEALSTSFTSAHINGYDPNQRYSDSFYTSSNPNLSTSYRPTAMRFFTPGGSAPNGNPYWNRATYSGGNWNYTLEPDHGYMPHYNAEREVIGSMLGTNSGSNAPYFDIPGFVNIDNSRSGHDPNTNLVRVKVGGVTFSDAGTLSADTCTTRNDPAVKQYRTRIIGTTLRLCFYDHSDYYNNTVEVTLKDVARQTGEPASATAGVPAYYYRYDETLGSCAGSTDEKKVMNACYAYVQVGSAQDTEKFDMNGDGRIDAADVVTSNDRKQNFANWYSFYRTRNLAAIGAVSNAFLAQLPATTRLAWQALNSCRVSGTGSFVTSDCEGWQSGTSFDNALTEFTGTGRTQFFTWLQRLPSSGGTPLRSAAARAGSYYSTTTGTTSPYNNTPDNASSGKYSCRKNYQIIMTDGRWNSNDADSMSIGNADSAEVRPYRDSNSNSLADISYYYWKNDLATGLLDDVSPSITDRHNCPSTTLKENYASSCSALYQDAKNDPQYKQHMVNFTIGFGLKDFLLLATPALTWGGDTFSGSYSNLVSGVISSWPATDSTSMNGSGSYGNVADLWHAALNSRGRFYNTDGPESLNTAFADILNNINSQSRAGGGAGAAASQVVLTNPDPNDPSSTSNLTTVFTARYDADMSGHILAQEFDAATGAFNSIYWDAATLLPATANRTIFTYNGGNKETFSACTVGRPLTNALNLPPPLANGTQPAADNQCAQRLNWLRSTWLPLNGVVSAGSWTAGTVSFTVVGHGFVTGDTVTVSNVTPSSYNGTYAVTVTGNTLSASLASNPGTFINNGNGRVAYTSFRNRATTALGDVMGSDLVYSGRQDYGYAGSDADPDDNYAAYVAVKAARVPQLLVGGNDGMLHVIRADTSHVDSGKELMAYVPAGVYGRLNYLPDGGYTHKFYVNGKLTIGDAYLSGQWRTVAVGTLAQGGKTVYALDISTPYDTDPNHAVKWEYNYDGTDDDMGLSFGKPSIVRLTSGWAAVFGNGYNSTNERAYLYVVDLDSGALLRRIATDTSTSNGLSTPKLHDTDGNGVYDVAYAGDLQGNLWRFDLSDASPGSWSSRKLFAAGSSQPITAQPAITTHPLATDVMAPSSSVLVLFGTGSYVSPDDLTDSDIQGIYAIWDNPADTTTVPKSALLQQTFSATITQFDGTLWRESTSNPIDWGSNRGWYVNLLANAATPSGPSERVITSAKIIDANTGPGYRTAYGKDLWRAIFTTAISKTDPCSSGGESWLMEFDLHSGGHPQVPVLDFSRDGNVTNRDSRGAVDTNHDGKIDTDEAKAGTPVTGTKLLDMVVSDLEIVQYVPTESADQDAEDPSKGALYKLASGVGGGLEKAGGAQEGTEGAATPTGDPARVIWRQIY